MGVVIKHFGSQKGTVATFMDSGLESKTISEMGYFHSQFGKGEIKYERNSFIDILNDWGYFGPVTETPDWYTGEPWTS